MKKALALAFIVGLVTAPKAMAELKVGDDAPSITIKEWVKGEAFDMSKANDKDIIVVEFWATWCGPCRTSIPHMSDMQDHFKNKGVTFIGVTDEERKIVDKFLKDGGYDKKMRYRVAIDDGNKTSDAYMKASNQRGIPTAFVVQGGKLKWIGHPMDELGLTIAKLAGDEKYAKKEEEAKKKREKVQELMGKFQMAAQAEDWAKAVGFIDDALKVQPNEFQMMWAKYHILVTKMDKKKEAGIFGREVVSQSDSSDEMNFLAWRILTDEEFEDARDLKLAKLAAEKAMSLSDEKNPSVIDTYARALADTGDLKGAVKWQTKAVELADESMKEELQKNLDDFRKQLEKKA